MDLPIGRYEEARDLTVSENNHAATNDCKDEEKDVKTEWFMNQITVKIKKIWRYEIMKTY